MYQLRETLHTLAYHVRHFPWRLCFPAVAFLVRHGHRSLNLLEKSRCVGVVVLVLPLYIAVGDTYLVPPRLPCRPLCVSHYYVGREVVVDDYPESLGFHRCSRESLAVHYERLTKIKHLSCNVDVSPSDVCCLWLGRSLHDRHLQLMKLILVDSAEVAAVRGPKDRVRYCLANESGYPFRNRFLHAYHCKA